MLKHVISGNLNESLVDETSNFDGLKIKLVKFKIFSKSLLEYKIQKFVKYIIYARDGCKGRDIFLK